MPATARIVDHIASVKPEAEGPPLTYRGVLPPFNFYISQRDPVSLLKECAALLKQMEAEKMEGMGVDWEQRGWDVLGRAHSYNDEAEFKVTVFGSSDNQYKVRFQDPSLCSKTV